MVILTLFAWIFSHPFPKITWFLSGIALGLLAVLVMRIIRSVEISKLLFLIILLTYILALFSRKLLPGLMGFASGVYSPFILYIFFYQVIHKKFLTEDEIRQIFHIHS